MCRVRKRSCPALENLAEIVTVVLKSASPNFLKNRRRALRMTEGSLRFKAQNSGHAANIGKGQRLPKVSVSFTI